MEPTWNLELTVLGGLGARVGGRSVDLGGPKQRLVLALLLLAEGRPLTVDRLVDDIWGSGAPERAEQSLQSYVSNLRRLLEPDRPARGPATVILSSPAGYSVVLDRGQLDLARFVDLSAGGTVDDLGTAMSSWAPLLPEFPDNPTVVEHARRLDAIHADVRERWFAARLEAGEDPSLVADLRTAVAEDPLDERLWAHLALSLYRSGRQTEALRAIDEARTLLADQIGVDPGPALRRLEADILEQSPALDGPTHLPTSPAAPAMPHVELVAAGSSPTRPFVGRRRELTVLRDALRHLTEGAAGAAIVVSGEPGIGKTRLADVLAAEARSVGLAVAWARCPENGATGPFHAIGDLAEQLDAQGVVDLDARRRDEPPADDTDPLTFYRRTVDALRRCARPAVIVVDDIHWADPGTLRLIEYMAGDLHDLPLLLVLTTRPVTADSPEPLGDCLAELARVSAGSRLDVGAIDIDDVRTWITTRTRADVDPRVATLVHDRSGGNPFFTQELVELLVGEDRLDTSGLDDGRVPAAVADVVRRRVGRLPAATQRVLSIASVVGRTFDLDVTAVVSGEPVPTVLDALDPAVVAGLVAPDPSRPTAYRFSHALVADALATELSPSRRARLHAAAATAISTLRAGRHDEHLAELAHHALAGAPAGSAVEAVEWCRRAGARAESLRAPEDAAGHYSRAIGVVDLAHPGDLRVRLELLRSLSAAWALAGSEERAQVAAADAIAVADRLDDVDAMVEAALGMVQHTLWQPGEYGETDDRTVAAVDRVLDRIESADAADLAVLRGFRANLGYYSTPPASLDAASAEAVALARSTADPTLVARSLAQRLQSIWFADAAQERMTIATELVALGRDPDIDPQVAVHGALTRLVAAYQLGSYDPDDLVRLTDATLESGTPIQLLELQTFAAARLAVEGRYRESLSATEVAEEMFRATQRRSRDAVIFGSKLLVLVDLDMTEELLELSSPMAGSNWDGILTETLAFVLLELGLSDRAREVVGRVGSVPRVRYDWMWLPTINYAATVRGTLGDRDACAALLPVLSPFAGQVAIAGSVPIGGCVDTSLSRMAMTLGEHDAALRFIESAIDVESRMGTRAWLVRALEVKADLTGATSDRRAVLDLATEIGCRPVLRRLSTG